MQENKDIKIFLADIERAISEIFDFLPEERNFLEFQKDIKTRKAVERTPNPLKGALITRAFQKSPLGDLGVKVEKFTFRSGFKIPDFKIPNPLYFESWNLVCERMSFQFFQIGNIMNGCCIHHLSFGAICRSGLPL